MQDARSGLGPRPPTLQPFRDYRIMGKETKMAIVCQHRRRVAIRAAEVRVTILGLSTRTAMQGLAQHAHSMILRAYQIYYTVGG